MRFRYGNEEINIISNPQCGKGRDEYTKSFSMEIAENVKSFYTGMPKYKPTPLRSLDSLSADCGVAGIFVKDESFRFGLNAFKALGSCYAMSEIDISPDTVFITATDGNHGRGVAWAARELGCRSVVYMPRGTARERLDNILALGADASILDMKYDDAVRQAAEDAEKNGWITVQDTSRPGYTEIPLHIMQGYTMMLLETVEQLGGVVPTHVFLQAGVGSMAGAAAAFLTEYYGEKCPVITIVEPDKADCFFKTVMADDGNIHFCEGEMDTIMAGLACGEPCPIAWDILKRQADFFTTIPDTVAAEGMRLLAKPMGNDPRIESGESGASAFGFIADVLRSNELGEARNMLGINEKSVILCISTEGATDRENYNRIVNI